MRNKLRFFAVIIVICFLFYMRNDPQDAKMLNSVKATRCIYFEIFIQTISLYFSF